MKPMHGQPTDAERASLGEMESAREQKWAGESFLRDLFLGRLRLSLIHPFPNGGPERPAFTAFYNRFKEFLRAQVDPVQIDATGEYPPAVLEGLKRLGAFGLKIPEEYGGLGFSQVEFNKVMELLGGHDRGLAVLLAASQAIGVPQPVRLFGTEEQKREYLPRCAAGAISGFALTETGVGSDPAALATTAEPTADGTAFILNGEKLWISNGPIAELLVVAARNPRTDRISTFVVETGWEGVRLEHRCRFMGLRGEANGVVSFTGVRVPRKNLLGEEGKGLKVALVTLNAGRLSLPAISAGVAKQCLEICRKWASVRSQWGRPIGQHEANAHKLADMAATVFAMETLSDFAARMADRGDYDIRLEAAAAKEWNTTRAWQVIDETLQIRGGRGYETEVSLAARGEAAIGVERMLRDARVSRIFEGASEIMHLFIAREAVDAHLRVAGTLIEPDKSRRQKIAALPRILAYYVRWYPGRWLGWGRWPRYREFGRLARYLRFVDRASRRMARAVFHGMLVYRGGLRHKQAFLFRIVDAAMELFIMALCVTRVQSLKGNVQGKSAERLAETFCRSSRRRVRSLLRDLWRNDDTFKYGAGLEVLAGEHAWLEQGPMELGITAEQMRPASVAEKRRAPAAPEIAPSKSAAAVSPYP